MAALQIKSFGGITPKVPPRYLQDSQAQVALNTDVFQGALKPLAALGSTVATLTKTGTPLTIYRYGQSIISDSQYWFHWTTDVDVCRSQIAGDTSEWTFYTGDGVPQATYNAIALSGSNYPTVSRPLGVPAPVTAATVSVVGDPTEEEDIPETRVYTYTDVSIESGFEFESAPAPASTEVSVRIGQSVTVGSFASIPAGYNITHRRIYRATSGVYLYVAQIAVATASYSDSVSAENLGEELPSLTWLPPPSTLKGLINLPGGIMAGFTGRDVYFCDPYHPHAWPVQYMQSLDFPVVGLGRMDTTLAVMTTGTPYFIQGSSPDSMVVVKSDLEQSCVSKRSIVSLNGAVLYASPDGLVSLSPNGSKIITEKYFTRTQWQTLFTPSTIYAYQHDMKYFGFYNNGVTSGGFIYDTSTGEFVTHDIYAAAGYNDLQVDKLFLAGSDRAVKVWGAGALKTVTWKSKKFTLPQVLSFSCAQLEAESYPMTAKIYAGGTLVHTQTVTSRDVFRLPATPSRDWEFQFEGSAEVFSFAVAQSVQELASV
jgi:hypothetical protein